VVMDMEVMDDMSDYEEDNFSGKKVFLHNKLCCSF
jgi:hypothetical protein